MCVATHHYSSIIFTAMLLLISLYCHFPYERKRLDVAKYSVPYLEFVLCIQPIQLRTHTVNTHPEQWAANAVAPGEQLGVRCLAQGSHLSRGIEGGERERWTLSRSLFRVRVTFVCKGSHMLSCCDVIHILMFK